MVDIVSRGASQKWKVLKPRSLAWQAGERMGYRAVRSLILLESWRRPGLRDCVKGTPDNPEVLVAASLEY